MTRAGFIRTAVILAALGGLEAACRSGLIDRFSLTPPSEMAVTAVRILASGEYTKDILATFATVAGAAALSVAAGFWLGVVLYRFPA